MEYYHRLELQKEFFADPMLLKEVPSYKLHAVVLHHGRNATEGHYTAYVKDEETNWWLANDANVSMVDDDNAIAAQDKVGESANKQTTLH